MWGAGLGLIGLLIAVGLVLYLETSNAGPAIKAGEQAKSQIRQYGGVDENGEISINSAKFEGLTQRGKLRGLLATDVTDDGSYDKYLVLQKEDTIVATENNGYKQTMKDFQSEEDARNGVDEAFRKSGHIFVMRDDKELQLPAAAGTPQPVKHNGDSLQNQLDAIQSAPR